LSDIVFKWEAVWKSVDRKKVLLHGALLLWIKY
jgi:hypothetical protein